MIETEEMNHGLHKWHGYREPQIERGMISSSLCFFVLLRPKALFLAQIFAADVVSVVVSFVWLRPEAVLGFFATKIVTVASVQCVVLLRIVSL